MLSLPSPELATCATPAPRVRRIGNAWLLLASQVMVTLGPAATRAPGFTVHMDREGFIFAAPAGGPAPELPPGTLFVGRIGPDASVLDLARQLAAAARTRTPLTLVDED